ncbi:PLP-dependent aminotransferase family protein [Paenibacillus lautus]|uniref:MocR-like pyridoxine biosynthesis transcription factor PdxR n=1 Tax=Paenibacillus lautus TaxID=1401 RepID=UPI003D272A74
MWGITLHRSSEVSLKRQIYLAIRERIVQGILQPGEAMPSSRQLAIELKVSRNTVNEAFDMLNVEGYVVSRQGAPTRVAEGIVLDNLAEVDPPPRKKAPPDFAVDFRTGQPELRLFPRYVWQQISMKTLSDMSPTLLGYTGPQGLPSLRDEISLWLYRSKGLKVDAQDIFITAGATHALNILADLLYHENQDIWFEDPCNIEMLQTFINKGYRIHHVPVDEHGIQTEHLNDKPGCPVYVTPSHQFPLGGILPADRRAALIRYARKNGSYIIEDDYDSEYRYSGDSIAPLYAMDPDRVIYVGTFSKVLFPALRIGYAIVPRKLQQRWGHLRTHTDVQNPPFEQAALAEFLHTRKFDRHIGKMRKIYGERRQVLLSSLHEFFGDTWRSWGDAAGLHLTVEFPGAIFDEAFRQKTRQDRIRITPLDYHCIQKRTHANKLLFGYGHLEPAEIRSGISLLQAYLKKQGYL